MTELRKCSKCRSTKLGSYFGLNVKGELFKTCNSCRKVSTLESEVVIEARKAHIAKLIESFPEDIEFCKILKTHDPEYPTDQPDPLVFPYTYFEWQLFKFKDNQRNLTVRWRHSITMVNVKGKC